MIGREVLPTPVGTVDVPLPPAREIRPEDRLPGMPDPTVPDPSKPWLPQDLEPTEGVPGSPFVPELEPGVPLPMEPSGEGGLPELPGSSEGGIPLDPSGGGLPLEVPAEPLGPVPSGDLPPLPGLPSDREPPIDGMPIGMAPLPPTGPTLSRPINGPPPGSPLPLPTPADRGPESFGAPFAMAPLPPPGSGPSLRDGRLVHQWEPAGGPDGFGGNAGPIPQFEHPVEPPHQVTFERPAEDWRAPMREAFPDRPPRDPVEGPQPSAAVMGLDEFCPVTLVETGEWATGDKRWGAVHAGTTYLFASPEQQQKFLTNPLRYAPVLGGDDPVLAADQQESVKGKTDLSVTYDGRLYMFATQASLARFRLNPRRYSVVR